MVDGDAGAPAPSGTPAGQRAVDQLGDGRLGEEADRQVGDGDADLGAGELGRQRAQRQLDALRRRCHPRPRPGRPCCGRRSRRRTPRRRRRRRPRSAAARPPAGSTRSSVALRGDGSAGRQASVEEDGGDFDGAVHRWSVGVLRGAGSVAGTLPAGHSRGRQFRVQVSRPRRAYPLGVSESAPPSTAEQPPEPHGTTAVPPRAVASSSAAPSRPARRSPWPDAPSPPAYQPRQHRGPRSSAARTGTSSAASRTASRRRWRGRSAPPAAPASGSSSSSTRAASRTRRAEPCGWWPGLSLGAGDLWHRQQRRDRGRLGGDGQLPALGAAAPDHVPPPGPGGDDRVLGEPLQRPGQRRRRVHLAHRPTATSSARTRSARSTTCCRRRSPTRRWGSTSTTPSARSGTRTRTSAASCSSCTPSAAASYTEDDVKNSARILTGYRVDDVGHLPGPYDPERPLDAARSRCWASTTRTPTRTAAGRPAAYLDYLARHPATARRIARKLAREVRQRQPADALVDRLAQVYLEQRHRDQAGAAGAGRLLASSRAPSARRCATPARTSSRRTAPLGVRLAKPPQRRRRPRTRILWQAAELGQRAVLLAAARRAAVDNDSWSSPSRMLASMNVHYVMSAAAGGRPRASPTAAAEGLGRRSARSGSTSWSTTCRSELLHQRVDRRAARGLLRGRRLPSPRERITRTTRSIHWNLPRLLTTFLDSPDFLPGDRHDQP